MQEVLQRRVILFGGKGGVGKSVCACALATQLAEQGRKTLVYSVDPAHSLSDCFDVEIGNRVTSIAENLYGFEVNASELLDDLKRTYSESASRTFGLLLHEVDLPFDRKIVAEIMDLSPPGLDELMGLSKLADFIGGNEYDSIMVDLAAGAHTIRLIQLPRLFEEWLKKTFNLLGRYRSFSQADELLSLVATLRNNASAVREIFADRSQTMLVPVTTPETLPIIVAEDIVSSAKSIGMHTSCTIVNQIVPQDSHCLFCEDVEREQFACLSEIERKFPGLYAIHSPFFPRQISGLEMLGQLGEILCGSPEKKGFAVEARAPHSAKTITFPKLVFRGDLRVMMFGGKGGCGKTTCSAATGALAAEIGKKVLVFSVDPQRSLSDIFSQELGDEIVSINGLRNLHALQIHPQKLLDEFKERNREEILEIVSDAMYIKREEASDFLDLSLPGMDEVVALLKLAEILDSEEYDLLILDTAPTGHALRFLEMPLLLSNWTRMLLQMRYKTRYIAQTLVGRNVKARSDMFLENTRKEIRNVHSIFTASDTGFFPVTTADEMALAETRRLLSFLTAHEMNVAGMVINKIVSSRENCMFCASRSGVQQTRLQNWRVQFSEIPKAQIPTLPHEIKGLEELKSFAQLLYEPLAIL
jgi:arsenite/tail-anchored protein-transporting ATPase